MVLNSVAPVALMKHRTFLLVIVCLAAGLFDASISMAETDTPESPMQAKLLRSTTGRALDNSGFANIPTPLKKDAVYDVVKQTLVEVTVEVEGQDVVVSSRDVLITAKKIRAAASGASPGKGAGGSGRSAEAQKFLEKLSPKAQEKFQAEVSKQMEKLKTMEPDERKALIREIFIRIMKEDQAGK